MIRTYSIVFYISFEYQKEREMKTYMTPIQLLNSRVPANPI